MDEGEGPHAGRLDTLDGLRGLAAIVVVAGHMRLGQSWGLLANYNVGVDVFLALSGYVIARGYESRFERGLGLRRFLALRAARLWPMVVVAMLVGGLVWVGHGSPVIDGDADLPPALVLLLGTLLIPTSLSGSHMVIANRPLWSLLYELLANVVHRLGAWRQGTRTLAVAWAACAGVALAACLAGRASAGISGDGDWLVTASRLLAAYLAGVLLWRLDARLSVLPRLPFAVCALFFVAVTCLPVGSGGIAANALVMAGRLALAPLVVLVAADPAPRGRLVASLGTLSYPLYAIHYPVVTWLLAASIGARFALALRLATLLGLCLAAWAIGRRIDGPVVRRLQRAIEARASPRRVRARRAAIGAARLPGAAKTGVSGPARATVRA